VAQLMRTALDDAKVGTPVRVGKHSGVVDRNGFVFGAVHDESWPRSNRAYRGDGAHIAYFLGPFVEVRREC
jgi:hypothetical protein